MELVQRRCCGIDVHKKKLMVRVLPPQGGSEAKPLEREFRTFTRDLRDLRQWLKECGVTEVVMEATGQYWRPGLERAGRGNRQVDVGQSATRKSIGGAQDGPN